MPAPNRPPADDDGFEVVDNPPPKPAPKPPAGKPPVAKLLPPKPGQPTPAPRPAPARPKAPAPVDAGFEVVDDYPPPAARKKPAPVDSGFEVVDDQPPPPRKKKPAPPQDDFEVVDDDPPPKSGKKKAAAPADDFEVVDDEDDTPQSKRKTKQSLKLTDDTEVDDRPAKKGKKKKKGKKGAYTEEEEKDMEREKEDFMQELMLCGGVGLIGFCLLMFAAYRLAGTEDLTGRVSVGLMMALAMVYIVIKIPVTIVGLMIVGKIAGIEYGTIGSAVRNLAAINLMTDGVYWLGDTLPVPWFAVCLVGFLVTFGLFQTLFRLDVEDVWTTLGFLNIVSFLMKILFIVVVIGFLFAASRAVRVDRDPAPNGKGGNNNQWVAPDDMDEDPDEDEPRPKNRRR